MLKPSPPKSNWLFSRLAGMLGIAPTTAAGPPRDGQIELWSPASHSADGVIPLARSSAAAPAGPEVPNARSPRENGAHEILGVLAIGCDYSDPEDANRAPDRLFRCGQLGPGPFPAPLFEDQVSIVAAETKSAQRRPAWPGRAPRLGF